MARIGRVIAEGYPHHITQRGNRRQQTFFSDEDYEAYVGLMAEWCRKETWGRKPGILELPLGQRVVSVAFNDVVAAPACADDREAGGAGLVAEVEANGNGSAK